MSMTKLTDIFREEQEVPKVGVGTLVRFVGNDGGDMVCAISRGPITRRVLLKVVVGQLTGCQWGKETFVCDLFNLSHHEVLHLFSNIEAFNSAEIVYPTFSTEKPE